MAAIRQQCCHDTGFCFMANYHADISDFDDDLPGSCEYTDIDAFVECGRHYLFTEFKKSVGDDVERHWAPKPWQRRNGQMLALERLSEDLPKSTVWLVEGDAPNRQCTRIRECVEGRWTAWADITWDELKLRHKGWLRTSTTRFQARLLAQHAAIFG